MSKIILEAKNISKEYFSSYNQSCLALKDFNLEIHENEIICIVGESGSGKSTLLNLLSALTKPTNGEIYFRGQNLGLLKEDVLSKIRNKNFGFIFQFHNLLPEFTVLENVLLPLMIDQSNFNLPSAEEKARTLLRKLGIIKKIKNFPKELSGGEAQRVAIARALINEPELIFADEPTGNLDALNRAKIYEILQELSESFKSSIVLVTHDKEISLNNYNTKLICLKDGYIVWFFILI